MLYGYIRFTVGDNQDNSLEAQTNLLKKNGCNNIFVEDSECTAAYHPVFESLILNTFLIIKQQNHIASVCLAPGK